MTTCTPPPAEAPLMLSVSGARGLVGRSMTPSVAADFAAAYGSHVKETTGRSDPRLCVGRDGRSSGEMLTAAAVSGLLSVGCRVIDLGVVPTPTVGIMIGAREADGGLVVTASHNPMPWNGLKCLDATGLAPPPATAAGIVQRFRERRIDYATVDALHAIEADDTGLDVHVQRVLDSIDPEPVRAAGFPVVLDSVNASGGRPGRRLLERLGCSVEHLNESATGVFAHEPEPIEANLTELAARVAATDAVCGFAQDPDADRLAVVDETGRYIGEEYTLVLAARRVLDVHRGGPMAANLSTSRMIDDLAAEYAGASVVRTAVGEANVASAMRDVGAIVGGEGNGGVIFPAVGWVRDSLSAIALVLGLLAAEGRPLSAIVSSLPRYCMIKRKVDLSRIGGADAVGPAIDRVVARFPDAAISTVDGARLDFADGWVHLRPSNTEPIARIIAEAATAERANAIATEVATVAGWA